MIWQRAKKNPVMWGGLHLCGEVKLMGSYRWAHRHGNSSGGGDPSVSVSRLHALSRENQKVWSGHGTDVLTGKHSWLPVHGPEPPAWTHTHRHTWCDLRYSKNAHLVSCKTLKQQRIKKAANNLWVNSNSKNKSLKANTEHRSALTNPPNSGVFLFSSSKSMTFFLTMQP